LGIFLEVLFIQQQNNKKVATEWSEAGDDKILEKKMLSTVEALILRNLC
jgi:hypothetical protein